MRIQRLLLTLPVAIVAIASIKFVTHWQAAQAARPAYDQVAPAPAPPRLAPEPKQSEPWTVTSVTDGDTLVVRRGSQQERIRLCGIDAPEQSQPFGPQAAAYLQRLTSQAQNQVMLVPVERDRYGRIVAEVFTLSASGERFLQQELLVAGMAYVYPQYVDGCPNGNGMRMAETIGQRNRAGVWSSNHQRPWVYRQQQRQ